MPSKELYRSKFEANIAASLKRRRIAYKYEERPYTIYKRVIAECKDCGSRKIHRKTTYTPDWFIYKRRKLQFIVETKGKFTASNRETMLVFKEQYPDIDIRIVFMRDNKIHKRSDTRYSDWAIKNGFEYAIGDIPTKWISN